MRGCAVLLALLALALRATGQDLAAQPKGRGTWVDNLHDRMLAASPSFAALSPRDVALDAAALGKSNRAPSASRFSSWTLHRPSPLASQLRQRRELASSSFSPAHDDSPMPVGDALLTRRGAIGLGVASSLWAARSEAASQQEKAEAERLAKENNQKIKNRNRAPTDFPTFIRDGYSVQVETPDGYKRQDNGLIYYDFEEGQGRFPVDGDQVIFDYVAFNENGGKIDSSYAKNEPGIIRLGPGSTLIPGLDSAIKTMKAGGQRRVIVPPELGPPVGPSTFFSAKQWEVFDIQLRGVKKCDRVEILGGFTSTIECKLEEGVSGQ